MLRRFVVTLAALVVSSLVLVVPAGAAVPDAATAEGAFVADINALRMSKGLAPLTVDARLVATAEAWARQMAANGGISHKPDLASTGPSGWQKLGENVGVGVDEPGLHAAFVRSAPHYANLVDGGYNAIGVGVIVANGRMWVAEEFMQSSTIVPGSAAVQSVSRKAKLLRYWSALSRKARISRFSFNW